MRPLRVLSLGAGVQSSAVALMMKHGEIEKADVMIFADTGAEPPSVYTWIKMLKAETESTMPFVSVQRGRGLTVGIEDWIHGRTAKKCWLPLFTSGGGRLPVRICTGDYKVKPIRAYVRSMTDRCVMVRGISFEERRRAKPSDVKWCVHEHPLCDIQMTRNDCKRWLVSHGYPIPPRSACVYCPNRCNTEWERMRTFDPDAWDEACRMDELMREKLPAMREKCYVHRQLVPLREAKIEDDTANRFPGSEGWGVECEGMCGV